jgi:hypothetical protein
MIPAVPETAANPPAPQVSLEDAIDALLAEIDTTCAKIENPSNPDEDEALADLARAVQAANALSDTNKPEPAATPAPATPEPPSTPDPIAAAEQALDAAAASTESLLEQAADDLVATLATPTEPESAPEAQPEPEPVVDEVPEPVAAPSIPEPEPEPAPALDLEAAADLLEQAVSNLLDEPAAAAEPPAPPAPSMDDLLDGSFESPDGEMVDTAAVDTRPDPALLLDQDAPAAQAAQPAPAAAAPIPQPVPETVPAPVAEAVAPAPLAASVVTPEPIPTPVAAPAAQPARPPAFRRILTWIGPRIRPLVAAIAKPVTPLAAKAVMLISKPLEGKPPKVRDSIGWVAIWTMFLAVCVWAYVLLRPPVEQPNDGMATAVVSAETDAAAAQAAPTTE